MFRDYTILLVEDDMVMQELIRYMLKDECKELLFADNGIEGIEEYKKSKPDLIITDFHMPKIIQLHCKAAKELRFVLKGNT